MGAIEVGHPAPVGELLREIVSLADPATRAASAARLGVLLGGTRVIVFVRDAEVGLLLPAPGFPQTLPGARRWRRFLDACVAEGESCAVEVPSPDDGGPVAAFGFACGSDVVAVVTGTTRRSEAVQDFKPLLPLLAAAFHRELAAAHARSQATLARQAAMHAEAMAVSLEQTRAHLHEALVESQRAGRELQEANERLQDQAAELEAQAEELATGAEELRRTNEELERARAAAVAANRAKSEFLATMSHELRTPLNAIGGHLQLIELGIHGPLTEAQRQALARIDRSQRHLLGLINDVLNLARIESGRVEYRIDDVPLREVLDDLYPMIEPQLGAKKLRYAVDFRGPSFAVRADREKLQQILLNLLSNAIKFTDPGGRVVVSVEGRDDAVGVLFVRVTDSGVGIPADRLNEVFEPFVQVDASHSRSRQGTGLGLAISRDLARGMGGDLRARSTVGEGSSFTLTLPASS